MSNTKPSTFKKTIRITSRLLEDLKNGRTELMPGQWCYSSRFNKKVKYVGTFYRSYKGVVGPYVKFSERNPSETILDWNIKFKNEREQALREQAQAKRLLRRQGSVNRRQEFVNRPTVPYQPPKKETVTYYDQSTNDTTTTTPESKTKKPIIKKLLELWRSL